MALATGDYDAVVLWADCIPNKRFCVLKYVLTSGERGHAMLFRDALLKLFSCVSLIKCGDRWVPRDSAADQPVLALSLKFSPKHVSNELVGARRTGVKMKCDIHPPPMRDLSYEDF